MGRKPVLALISFVLALSGCPNPAETPLDDTGVTPTVYERIIIDTYSPNRDFTAQTYIDLFDANGDPDDDDPWTGDDTKEAIASADNGSNPDYPGTYSRIDYTGGLSSGTYYIRVRGATRTVEDFYAIRVLSLQIGEPIPDYIYPGANFALPDALEEDDKPVLGGVPLAPPAIALNDTGGLSRYLDGAKDDVDWFKLVLP
jgi:hypothetical protein